MLELRGSSQHLRDDNPIIGDIQSITETTIHRSLLIFSRLSTDAARRGASLQTLRWEAGITLRRDFLVAFHSPHTFGSGLQPAHATYLQSTHGGFRGRCVPGRISLPLHVDSRLGESEIRGLVFDRRESWKRYCVGCLTRHYRTFELGKRVLHLWFGRFVLDCGLALSRVRSG